MTTDPGSTTPDNSPENTPDNTAESTPANALTPAPDPPAELTAATSAESPAATTPKRRHRMSKEQRALIVRLIKKLLCMGKYTSEVKTAIVREFHLSRRSVERYITSARREMVERLDISIAQHRAESFYFYRSVIESPRSTQRDRLRARERIDKLLGADSATRHKNEMEIDLSPADIRNMSDEELEATYQRLMFDPEEKAKGYHKQ